MKGDRLLVPTSGGGRVLPGALDVQEDCVGVVGEQKTSNQTKHLEEKHASVSDQVASQSLSQFYGV